VLAASVHRVVIIVRSGVSGPVHRAVLCGGLVFGGLLREQSDRQNKKRQVEIHLEFSFFVEAKTSRRPARLP